MRLWVFSGVALAVVAVVAIVVGALLLRSDAKPSAEEQETNEVIERFKLRIEPRVWRQVENQTWYDKGTMTPDGYRLLNLLSQYYVSQRAHESLQVLQSYKDGLSQDAELDLLGLKSGDLIRLIAITPWFRDGVDVHEDVFLDVLAAAALRRGTGWTFDRVLVDSMKATWFTDGLDEKESTVLTAAGALSSRNQSKAVELVRGLDSNLFLYQDLILPVSGAKVLIVTAASPNLQNQLPTALALVNRWMQAVEAFVGPYTPKHVLVAVEELPASLCGTGSGQRADVPGFVTLQVNCVQDTTVVHELAHIFIGSGPTWFAEGAADLVVHHVTGRPGNYLSRQATGKITLGAHLDSGAGDSPEYLTQGALGAKLMVELYRILGVERTSAVMKEITSGKWPKEGPVLVDLILNGTPETLKPRVSALLAERFDRIQ